MQAKPGKNISLAKAKPSKSASLCVTLRKNFAHFAVKKISLFLDRDVGSENQIYLSFDMPLREQRERETIKAKGFQEHTTCEGKAFEE